MENVIDSAAASGIRERLAQAKAMLDAVNREIAEFRRDRMAVVNGVSVYLSKTIAGRRELDLEWMRLTRARNRAWQAHQKCMAEYAEQKMRGVA